MILQQFLSQPFLLLPFLLAIFYCLTVHEFAHAWAATWQGDETARLSGRLTLNPLAHLDLFGFLLFLFAGFGWAKPVPVNPFNFKNGKASDIIVSLAGIGMNILSLIIFAVAFKMIFPALNPLYVYGQYYTQLNLLAYFLSALIIMNLILAIFNLIPLPPLDGSHVLLQVLPDKFKNFKITLIQQGPFFLLIIIVLDNFLGFNILGHFFNFFLKILNSFFN